jgi:hypothetical protein
MVLYTFKVICSAKVSILSIFGGQKLGHRRTEQLLLDFRLASLAANNHHIFLVDTNVICGVRLANTALVVLRFIRFHYQVYAVITFIVAM